MFTLISQTIKSFSIHDPQTTGADPNNAQHSLNKHKMLMFGNEKTRTFVNTPEFCHKLSARTHDSSVRSFIRHLSSLSCPSYYLILFIADKFLTNIQPTQQKYAARQIHSTQHKWIPAFELTAKYA